MTRVKFITHTGICIRSSRYADILFHAVAPHLLPLVTRSLDEAERLQMKSSCVYLWEEHNPSHSQFNVQLSGNEALHRRCGRSPSRIQSPRSRQSGHPFHKAEVEIRPRPETYDHRFWFPCPSSSFFAIAPGSIRTQVVEQRASGV